MSTAGESWVDISRCSPVHSAGQKYAELRCCLVPVVACVGRIGVFVLWRTGHARRHRTARTWSSVVQRCCLWMSEDLLHRHAEEMVTYRRSASKDVLLEYLASATHLLNDKEKQIIQLQNELETASSALAFSEKTCSIQGRRLQEE